MSEPTTTFLEALVEAIKRAGSYNKNDQAAPVAVLWPDKDRQWEPLLPLLRSRLPLLTFGAYDPENRAGPAYWLRCMLARTLPECQLPWDETPIIYLPGVSRQELRASEETPRIVQPLAELQYRGVAWTHKNGRDWSILAFLLSFKVDVAADAATRAALQRALLKLVDEPITRLQRESPLKAAFFDTLLNPDEARNLLLWLNDPAGYLQRCSKGEWAAFCSLCASKYGFHPEKDGPITGARLFGLHQDAAWGVVWNRFAEAPHAYPNLPELLRSARPEQMSLFTNAESWPQDNEDAEKALRESLANQRNQLPQAARATVYNLEKEHAARRSSVWATLGRSPLALALSYLTVLARESERAFGGTTVPEIRTAYIERGWQVDAAVIDALATVIHTEDVSAVKAAITAIYRPWLENAASVLQKAVYAGHSTQTYPVIPLPAPEKGTCILFSDGLRYDVGLRLADALQAQSLICQVDTHLAPFPGITPTAKPAISPVAALLIGTINPGLELVVANSGSKVNAEVLRKLLEQAGYQILRGEDLGDPAGRAWTEMGAIDNYGHQNSAQLPYHLKSEIASLARRIETLLNWGWKQVLVVTDHGWLLLPGDLPKVDLPEHLTHLRKGRCAQIKETSQINQETVPWYWNEQVRIALAPTIHCYEAGKEYEHGGLSPQECFVPVITVSQKQGAKSQPVVIEDVNWRGLRCRIRVTGITPGMHVDMRTKAGDASTSLLRALATPGVDGSVSLLVEDEDRMGEAVLIVVVQHDGTVSKQMSTIVGD